MCGASRAESLGSDRCGVTIGIMLSRLRRNIECVLEYTVLEYYQVGSHRF